MKEEISDYLKSLYFEFLHSDIIKLGYVRKVVKEGFQLELSLNYMVDMKNYQKVEELFKLLPSYSFVDKLMKESNYKDEINIYGVITYIFSDMIEYSDKCETHYSFSQKNSIAQLDFDEKQLLKAISNSICPGSFNEKKNKFIIIFENLNIDNSFTINEDLEFIKLTKQDINDKFNWQINNSSRIFCGLKISNKLLSNENIIPILGTLLRLYKNGDIKYKGIFEECNHLIKGIMYMPKDNSLSENDYVEHTPNTSHSNVDSWNQYLIKNDEIIEFSSFISVNIKPMINMPHTCHVYNMVSSTPLHLKIPLLFFVIESFFSDIDSEIVFRVSLYITNILDEDELFMQKLKKLYTIRSKIAHGDLSQAKKEIDKLYKNGKIKLEGFKGASDELYKIVHRLWFKLLSIDWSPRDSNKLIIPYLLKSKV